MGLGFRVGMETEIGILVTQVSISQGTETSCPRQAAGEVIGAHC